MIVTSTSRSSGKIYKKVNNQIIFVTFLSCNMSLIRTIGRVSHLVYNNKFGCFSTTDSDKKDILFVCRFVFGNLLIYQHRNSKQGDTF